MTRSTGNASDFVTVLFLPLLSYDVWWICKVVALPHFAPPSSTISPPFSVASDARHERACSQGEARQSRRAVRQRASSYLAMTMRRALGAYVLLAALVAAVSCEEVGQASLNPCTH